MERKIINALLSTTLVLGLVCVVTFYLPPSAPPPATKNEPSMSEMLATLAPSQAEVAPVQTTHDENVPQPLPPMPDRNRFNFTVPPELKTEVEFWRNIFARYNSNQVVLHDSKYLGIVYDVVDFTPLEENPILSPQEKERRRHETEESKRDDVALMLKNLADKDPKKFSDEERNLVGLFRETGERNALRKAPDRVRSQVGQKDRFLAGVLRAAPYLPHLEKIFIEEGAPPELSRLAFVESMFQLNARSKVGAAGPYQFMPGTAKHYLLMNAWVDERLDPLKAGRAAARLLKKQYQELGTWPLSLNAYNTGMLRMMQAVQRLGTRNIATIIHYFENPGYQFASRNFYPEFLAALEVADHPQQYFGPAVVDTPLQFVELQTDQPVALCNLAEHLGADIQVIRDLNPALNPRLFERDTYLPSGYSVRLPGENRQIYFTALKEIRNNEPSNVVWHAVAAGESLHQIAMHYKVAARMIEQLNQLNGQPLATGQLLQIPSVTQ